MQVQRHYTQEKNKKIDHESHYFKFHGVCTIIRYESDKSVIIT